MLRALNRRRQKGNALSEFGPAILVLLIFIFFPLVDLLAVVLAYAVCMVLNFNQVHEASLIPMKDAAQNNGTVKKGIVDQWLNGMGRLAKLDGYPVTDVSYRQGLAATSSGNGDPNNGVVDRIVNVSTTVKCKPFLNIPLPGINVPGLSGPMVFELRSERTMENPDYAIQ